MSHLYDTAKWRRQRVTFLRTNPLCHFCEQQGRTELATVVDHKVPHKGNPELFWDQSNWQGLCATDHSAAKQQQEKSGTLRGCDAHGRPLDPDHLWNREG